MNAIDSDIRTRSYFIWEREGRPQGRDWDHWFQAEAELRAEAAKVAPSPRRKATAKPKATATRTTSGTTTRRTTKS